MQQMKNSATATAELNKTNFAYKITRIIAAPQGLNSRLRAFTARNLQDSQHSLTSPLNFPKLLLFLLFSAIVFDKNTAGKRFCQPKRAGDLGLVSPANATVVFVVFSTKVQVRDFRQKTAEIVVFVVFGGFSRHGGAAEC